MSLENLKNIWEKSIYSDTVGNNNSQIEGRHVSELNPNLTFAGLPLGEVDYFDSPILGFVTSNFPDVPPSKIADGGFPTLNSMRFTPHSIFDEKYNQYNSNIPGSPQLDFSIYDTLELSDNSKIYDFVQSTFFN